jgi:hypothetical protein
MSQQNDDRRVIGLASSGEFVKRRKDRFHEFIGARCLAFDSRSSDAIHSPFLS